MFRIIEPPTITLRDLGQLGSYPIPVDFDRAEIHRHAQEVLEYYGLTAHGWSFAVDPPAARLGQCRYGPKVVAITETYLRVGNDEQIWDTLLHEVGHALDKVIYGVPSGHGRNWKEIGYIIGYNPKSCKFVNSMFPDTKYVRACPTHGILQQLKRKPRGTKYGTYICRTCGSDLEIYTRGTVEFDNAEFYQL